MHSDERRWGGGFSRLKTSRYKVTSAYLAALDTELWPRWSNECLKGKDPWTYGAFNWTLVLQLQNRRHGHFPNNSTNFKTAFFFQRMNGRKHWSACVAMQGPRLLVVTFTGNCIRKVLDRTWHKTQFKDIFTCPRAGACQLNSSWLLRVPRYLCKYYIGRDVLGRYLPPANKPQHLFTDLSDRPHM